MTRILVTGATGFVGRQIIRALGASGHILLPVVRAGKEIAIRDQPGIERCITTEDLFSEDQRWWEIQCKGVETVIHAAWYTEPGNYLHSPRNIECLVGSLRIAAGAARSGVKRFVGIGTCAEYEQSSSLLSIKTALKPETLYAAAKASLYLSLSKWLPSNAVSFAWCRLFYLYGEGEDERRLIPYIRKQIERGEPAELTNGFQVRDFIDVAVAGLMISEIAVGSEEGAFNVCSGKGVTIRQLAERVAAEYGRQDLLRFGDRRDNMFDPPSVIGVPNVRSGHWRT